MNKEIMKMHRELEFIEQSRKLEGVAKCPSCGCGLWYLDEMSLERGDEPTVARCANCKFETNV